MPASCGEPYELYDSLLTPDAAIRSIVWVSVSTLEEPMSVVVVATIIPLPEHRSDVVAAIESVIARVHKEDPGCETYALHEGRDRLVMIEKWAGKEALQAHGGGPATAALKAALDGKLEAPIDLQILKPHPAGTARQGVL